MDLVLIQSWEVTSVFPLCVPAFGRPCICFGTTKDFDQLRVYRRSKSR